MSGQSEQAKGRLTEAVGDVTDDRDLNHIGKVDRANGKLKTAAGNLQRRLTNEK